MRVISLLPKGLNRAEKLCGVCTHKVRRTVATEGIKCEGAQNPSNCPVQQELSSQIISINDITDSWNRWSSLKKNGLTRSGSNPDGSNYR